MSIPKLGSAHVPTLVSAVAIALAVLFLYHLVHKH